MAWTDTNLTNIKIRKIHIDEIVSRLNTERSERGYSQLSINITAEQSKILASHINDLRSAVDGTPLTVGCGTHHTTVRSYNSSYDGYCSNYGTAHSIDYGSNYSGHDSSENGTAKYNYALGSGNCVHYV
jgi:hypothetical protein